MSASTENRRVPRRVSDQVVLSASSVNTFIRCGHQWFLAYVAGIKAPPNLKAVRGIAVHAAVELDMRQKITSGVDLPVDDMLDAFDTSWTEETSDGFGATDDDPGAIKDAGAKLVKIYHREVAPKIQPALVEEPIQFEINGQPFSGQIDVAQLVPVNLYGDPEYRMEIRDTKTSSRAPDPTQYMLNMTGYAIGVRQATGEIEADTVFDYVVATTKPYYREIRLGGPVTDDDIRRFGSIVGAVAASIQAGTFVPNGLSSGACRWCGFGKAGMCPYYKEVSR